MTSIQMKLSDETVELVEELKYSLHTKNKANVVVSAIRTLHFLLKYKQKGCKIIIRDADGDKEREIEFIN